MRLPGAARLIALLLFLCVQLTHIGFGQIIPPAAAAKLGVPRESPHKDRRVSRRMKLESDRGLIYAGVFSSDAKFHAASRWDRFRTKKPDTDRQKFAPQRMLQSNVRGMRILTLLAIA